MKRTWNLAPVLQIIGRFQKSFCSSLYLLVGHVWWLWCSSKYILQFKIYIMQFKIYIQKCTVFHLLILIIMSYRMFKGIFKNTKTWISWEFSMCLKWHILRNYHFVAEITFMNWIQKTLDAMIGEKQKLLKIHYFYILLLSVVYIIDVSN